MVIFFLFRVYASNTHSGPWTLVLDKELEHGRTYADEDPDRLKVFALKRKVEAKFVRVGPLTAWDKGPSLQYFEIIRT